MFIKYPNIGGSNYEVNLFDNLVLHLLLIESSMLLPIGNVVTMTLTSIMTYPNLFLSLSSK